jgi:ABC-type dipeptide/oligopeptide/nickel transport system ATPase component
MPAQLDRFTEKDAKTYDLDEACMRKFHSAMIANKGVITIHILAQLCKDYNAIDLDGSIAICGQNGVGKSRLGLTICKYINEKVYEKPFSIDNNVIFSFHSLQYLMRKLMHNKDTCYFIDENNQFMSYKDHAKQSAKMLTNIIEICRANRNTILSANRDINKLDNNYRNGKVHTLLQVVARGPTGKPYTAVLQGNWFIESEDKFQVTRLAGLTSRQKVVKGLEKLDTFKGWLPYVEYLTEDELTLYRKYKDEQMKTSGETYCALLDAKDANREAKMTKQMSLF